VNFVVSTFAVQPGISSTFPWLANIAANWEKYRFNRIGFRFVSRSATSFTGSVVMAPDYDASDAPPPDYQTMSSYQNAISDAPWKDIMCVLSPRSTTLVGNSRFIRIGSLSDNEDIKLYDVANLQIATTGQANTSVVGELWVEYDLTLQIPQLQVGSVTTNISSGMYEATAGIDVNNLLGTAAAAQNGLVNIAVVGNTVTITNINVGEYYIFDYLIAASTTLTTIPTMTIVSGLAGLLAVQSVTNGTTKAQMTYQAHTDSSTVVFTLGGLTVVTGGTVAFLLVSSFHHAF